MNAQDEVKPFTLEQVMSAPFPSGLVAAPVGGSVAWVQIAKGSRNIWVASPPEYKGRQVTSYSGDDGEEIGELAWICRCSRDYLYTGGDLDNFGESPNPRSVPEEPKQLLWLVILGSHARSKAAAPIGGGPLRRSIPKRRSCRPHFQAEHLVSQAWWRQQASLFSSRQKGQSDSSSWSPDGSKLVFVNGRRDHGFVGVSMILPRRLYPLS